MELNGQQACLLTLTITLSLLCVTVLLLRIWARISIGQFGLDDWLMIIAGVAFVSMSGNLSWGALSGIGVDDVHLTPVGTMNSKHAFFNFLLLYILTVMPAKVSICLTLLRITIQKPIIWTLYAIMVISTVSGVILFLWPFSYCHPVSAFWDPPAQGRTCVPPQLNAKLSIFLSAIEIFTDLSCSTIPSIILWNLKMDKRRKLEVAAICSLGFLASICTMIRLPFQRNNYEKVNLVAALLPIVTLSTCECGVVIIAGSIPALQPLMRRYVYSAFSPKTCLSNNNSIKPADVHGRILSTIEGPSHASATDHRSKCKGDLESQTGIMMSTTVDFEEEYITEMPKASKLEYEGIWQG
ncbi:hypothetical protein BDV97DRAFT_81804 [Delphinella strobiligena]|nr:hypothetical protein BDV97DRAFT_81804 [Delphinella strobiligena]